jgi:ribosomal protein L11 methyltransferase
MPLSQLSTPLTREQAYALVDAVMERADLALTASAHEDVEIGEWVFEATCRGLPDVDSFSELARATLGGSVDFTVSEIDDSTDWVALSLEGLKPVRAGGVYIYGSHDAERIPHGVIPIRIEAAQAFGTGHHETTTGCLEAIARILKRKEIHRPLDVGTGTGVLAIAIAKRAHLPVLASDIDPVAVRTAAVNARDNGVGGLVRTVVATGLAHNEIARRAPYDLIVANILAGPLAALAPALCRAAGRRAAIVLSGILTAQAPRVLAAYRAQGAVLKSRIVKAGWTTLILEKL